MEPSLPDRIFMLGIGGMGMAPLAIYLAQSGCRVVGQDDQLQLTVRRLLESAGVEITDVQSIPDGFDMVGYSSAIRADHPLYQYAVRCGLQLIRRGALLAQVVRDKKLVAVVGSHGKTTTTGFIVQMLQAAQFDCGYVLGGLFKDAHLSPALYSKHSEWVVAEIDESDGTIDLFAPAHTLVVNFDWDHADRYPTADALKDTFIELFKRTAHLVYVPSSVAAKLPCHAQVYAECTEDFNLHNWNAAKAMCIELTGVEPPVSPDDVVGIKRRQDVLLDDGRCAVIADYAHHPTEIEALLKWCRPRYTGELVAVFQPHRYTRTQQFAREFATALHAADRVWLLPVYAASETMDPAGTSDQIALHGPEDWACVNAMECRQRLLEACENCQRKRVIVFIGAGDIDQLAAQLVEDYVWLQGVRPQLSQDTRLRVQEPLAGKTTLRVGGNARYYAEPGSHSDLHALLNWAQRQGTAVFVLGRGSNLIVASDGFDGLVVRLNHAYWRSVESLSDQRVRVGAGVRLKELCGQAAKHGLAGFEFLEGIPGTLGGALRMNAGAMGSWIFDVVESVEYVSVDGNCHHAAVDSLTVGYRYCEQLQSAVALTAILKSAAVNNATAIRLQMETYARNRKASQPKEPSAGCIFKNPEGGYAGKWIDECGLKGTRVGQAAVSQVHGNFIVNLGGATSEDVLALVKEVRQHVFAQKGVWLEPEVLLLGSCWEAIL